MNLMNVSSQPVATIAPSSAKRATEGAQDDGDGFDDFVAVQPATPDVMQSLPTLGDNEEDDDFDDFQFVDDRPPLNKTASEQVPKL